jgi:ribosomal protein L37AE/L43A
MSLRRLRDMKVRICPRCATDRLTFTGAFWSCGHCDYAITGAALAAEMNVAPRSNGAAPVRC